MTPDPTDWSFDACQTRLRAATQTVINAEGACDKAAQRSADAEAVYRSELGKAFATLREAGEAVEAAKIAAHQQCAKLSRERDYAADLVKLAREKIEDARDSRRSLWRMIEWARERDLAQARTAPTPAPAPEPHATTGRMVSTQQPVDWPQSITPPQQAVFGP